MSGLFCEKKRPCGRSPVSGKLNAPPPGDQVVDQDYHRHNQQKVDQPTGDMEAEAQKPQDQNDYEDRPKHVHLQLLSQAPGATTLAGSLRIGSC
jgi:hypothetical protein